MARTIQKTTPPSVLTGGKSVTRISASRLSSASGDKPSRVVAYRLVKSGSSAEALKKRPEWADQEYRHAYMEAAIEEGVAWQIRANRNFRKLSQGQVAKALNTQQSAISRLEDPEYGAHSLDVLKSLAKVFDCALLVKFVPYSVLEAESKHLRPEDLYAPSYQEEMAKLASDAPKQMFARSE